MGIIIKSAVLTPAVVDALTNYIISIGVISTANYVYIKYSDYATPTDAQMLDTPAAYMGVCVTDEETAPTTAVSYKWNLVRGPNEVTTATGTNITGLLKGNGTNVAGAVAGTDYIPPSGGTMTGALTLFGAPTNNLHAATKKYVDDSLSTPTLKELKRYTSSGTFNRAQNPSVGNAYIVVLVGGGGGGTYGSAQTEYGGGAGATVTGVIITTANITVTIGAGGSGGTSASTAGGSGGTTSAGDWNAPGGVGGRQVSASSLNGGMPGGGTIDGNGADSSVGSGGVKPGTGVGANGGTGAGGSSGGGTTSNGGKGGGGLVIVYGWQ